MPAEAAAKQRFEQILRRGRLDRPGEAKRQCGEQNAANTAERSAIGDSHGRLPTPGTVRCGVSINAALHKQLHAVMAAAATGWFNPGQS
jgi:hypothetical protein